MTSKEALSYLYLCEENQTIRGEICYNRVLKDLEMLEKLVNILAKEGAKNEKEN